MGNIKSCVDSRALSEEDEKVLEERFRILNEIHEELYRNSKISSFEEAKAVVMAKKQNKKV